LHHLVNRGLVQVSGVTPSDAAHVLGHVSAWDVDAAKLALELFARQRTGSGNPIAQTAPQMAQMIIDQLTRQSAVALLETAFAEETPAFGEPAPELARHILIQRGLAAHRGLLKLDAGLNLPVIGLGASARTYYPAVAAQLNCPVILPEHGDVANAIGAVVGRITMRRMGSVTSPSEGVFRIHLGAAPRDFRQSSAALDALEDILRLDAEAAALGAGAQGVQVEARRDIRTARIEGNDVFIEAEIAVEATGRPRIAI